MESDLALDELQRYKSEQTEPPDFDDFWRTTLNESREKATPPELVFLATTLTTLDVWDVTYSGFDGQRVKAWLRRPRGADGPLPTIVHFIGYGGGRGLPTENLLWPSSGFAHLYVDTRGQGSIWSKGDTPDTAGSAPQSPGFLTRGVLDPETFYYRRVFTDAVRAVETAREFPGVDGERIFVAGASQGGGIALAVAGMVASLAGVLAQVPFLCDFPRAARIHATDPYAELVRYLAIHRDHTDRVLDTLRYFDGVNHAKRASAPALFSVALMDEICKPSTVFAAYNAYSAEKSIEVYPFNGHEGGGAAGDATGVAWARERSSS